MASDKGVLGIVVGGGPAPGINGVIAAATIAARNHGWEVYGFLEGFRHLVQGSADHYRPLTIQDVAKIHYQGGSILHTSRTNPAKKAEHMANVVKVLQQLGVKCLVTIGGDDTAYSSSQVAAATGDAIRVVHVPKTIDNDLPLPPGAPTFGYETARHTGTELIRNLLADAQTAPRWYLTVAMGRSAGHLALGIGQGGAAPLTLIPEEFVGRSVTFTEICDVVEGAVLKSLALGNGFGCVVMAEGLLESMEEAHLEEVFGHDDIDRDDHGHIKLDDLELGNHVKLELRRRFKERGRSMTFIAKNIGYELRCADPIPFDREYTRMLGAGAVEFLMKDGSGAIMTYANGALRPMPFAEARDPKTGRPRVRKVDVDGDQYKLARSFMTRLERRDLETPGMVEKIAAAGKFSVDEFKAKFGYLMK
ncbi:MAG: diphosphate--fructose-6-phosphate 1-phosphotransferase [Planctomycetia bacterium]